MRRQEKVGTGFGLLVAPLLFGLYLAVTEGGGDGDGDAGRGGEAAGVGAGDRYDVRLRCLDEDTYQRERLRAPSHGDALASAEARNPGCKAVSAERARG